MGRPKGERTAGEQYQAKKGQEAARSRERSAAGREVGPLPRVLKPRRRARCRLSLRAFCETYLRARFPLAWSRDHLKVLDRLQACVMDGGQFALAMPRGSGKTTLCEAAAIWALLYCHRRFVVLVGATETAAEELLEGVRVELEANDLLYEDFPEVCHPIRALDGIANRCAGQTVGGQRTRIGWDAKELVLPTVQGSKASGARVRVAGITGRVRGMRATGPDGGVLRPDLVVINDQQTDETARSPSQNAAREKVMARAILGLAGPGQKIAAVCPCTVIAPGDLADRILDRNSHPEWQGERTRMLLSMPTRLALWEEYGRLRAEGLRAGTGTEAATAYYRDHQAEMDEGAEASWKERKNPDELSAIQHAMNLWLADPVGFDAEYQNAPRTEGPAVGDVPDLQADELAARLDRLPRGLVQQEATRLTAGIDVQGRVLFWAVAAWTEGFGGRIVDYGAWPRQSRAYYSAADAAPSLADTFPDMGLDGRIYASLTRLTEELLGRTWERDGGGEGVSIERCLVDANWGESTQAVYQFCRTSSRAATLLPSHGRGIGASALPMRDWSPRPGERRGRDWLIPRAGQGRGRHVTYEANSWKSFVAGRLLPPAGSPGALWLPGDRPHDHQLLADHLSAECPIPTHGRGRVVHEWRLRPDRRENHWLDCLVLCAVAASVQGLAWSPAGDAGQVVEQAAGPARVKLSDLQKAKRARGGPRRPGGSAATVEVHAGSPA